MKLRKLILAFVFFAASVTTSSGCRLEYMQRGPSDEIVYFDGEKDENGKDAFTLQKSVEAPVK